MGRLNKEQINFIKENVDTLTNQEIADKIGCCKSTVSNWRKKLGISFSELHDFSNYHKYIIANYNKKTSTALAKEIGCSKSYIIKVWRENNLQGKTIRRYYANFDYFNIINSPNKAYIIGLICSDGCIYKRDRHEGLWQITLQQQDEELLYQIKKEIKADNPIKYGKNTATLTIVNQKMYENLLNIGITPKKTYSLNLEEVIKHIPKTYWKDFLHGYFDGDGSITVRDIPSKSKIQFALPEHNISFFKEMLDYYGIKASWNKDNRTYKYTIPFGNLCINGADNKYCLLQLFKLENTISLKRKEKLIDKLCQQIQNNITNRKENITAVRKWGELLENLRR